MQTLGASDSNYSLYQIGFVLFIEVILSGCFEGLMAVVLRYKKPEPGFPRSGCFHAEINGIADMRRGFADIPASRVCRLRRRRRIYASPHGTPASLQSFRG
jgi:hypothetical protein